MKIECWYSGLFQRFIKRKKSFCNYVPGRASTSITCGLIWFALPNSALIEKGSSAKDDYQQINIIIYLIFKNFCKTTKNIQIKWIKTTS